MKERYIVSTAKGFICDVYWLKGRTYPERFGFDGQCAQTFTHQRAKVLERLCYDNWIDNVKIIRIR